MLEIVARVAAFCVVFAALAMGLGLLVVGTRWTRIAGAVLIGTVWLLATLV